MDMYDYDYYPGWNEKEESYKRMCRKIRRRHFVYRWKRIFRELWNELRSNKEAGKAGK